MRDTRDGHTLPSRRAFLGGVAAIPTASWIGSTALAQPGADQPPVALTDPVRDLKPTGGDLGSLFEQVQQLTSREPFPLSLAGDQVGDLIAGQRERARKRIFELLSYRPDRVEPQAEVVERVKCEGYEREKVLFSTGPQLRVPAYVLIPNGLRRPAPAIVDLHSHGGMFLFGKEKVVDLGRNHPVMADYHDRNYAGRPTATALVRRGYVVITIDAFFFGERRLILDEDVKYGWDRAKYTREDAQFLNQKCRGKETTLVKSLVLAGLTWPGLVAWDDIRTVDYLAGRAEVDPRRIGCLGISMGGYRSAYLTALDDRIKAACVVGFMSSVRPMMKAHVDTHSWVHFLPGLHQALDLPDVASLAVPRALLVQQCSRDRLFPAGGMEDSVRRIAEVYSRAKAKDRFEGRFYDEPHQFTRKMQDEAFAWLDHHLEP